MALRVLLADESSTIKKALQLALSDMGVTVKSVPSGLDVISVALDFRPDIVFADILLTKKNGYQVCLEIKKHSLLKTVPVILMWSSFMEIDHKLADQSGCNGYLEKPFDTTTLRSLIEKFVVKTQTHPLKGLLDFPPLPDFIESSATKISNQSELANKTEIEKTEIETPDETVEDYTFSKSFEQIKLKSSTTPPREVQSEAAESYRNEIILETENYGEFEEVVLVKSDHVSDSSSGQKIEASLSGKRSPLQDSIEDHLQNYLQDTPATLQKFKNSTLKAKDKLQFEDKNSSEIREVATSIATQICWQIIPEITERIVREELKKILHEIEKSV